jgi:hypothetical protein
MRHADACRWAAKDGNVLAFQQLLGHGSIVTTQRHARLSDGMVKAEVERLAGRSSLPAAAGENRLTQQDVAAQEDGGIAKW